MWISHFRKECTDERRRRAEKEQKRLTYKMPMLIATITPTFSLRFMVKVQIIFQGRMARTISMAPE